MLRIFLFFTLVVTFLGADGVKPAYLEVTQKSEVSYDLLLKVANLQNAKLDITLKPIKGCQETSKPLVEIVNDSRLTRYQLECHDGLKGKRIEVVGLKKREIDLLLRLAFLDGSSQSALLKGDNNAYSVKQKASTAQIVQTYTWLGITHILMGYDHLLFVFLLLLIVKSMRRLLWTISAFTLAHSLTMAGATLGLVHMPQQPVEAIIALSIVFLAVEIMHEKQGRVGLTSLYPWMVAFLFGLLHGFGFAGALSEVGVPEQAITLALIFFNIGVELGQLIFVLFVVLVALVLKRFVSLILMQKLEVMVIYAIGSLASFWMIERVLAF